MQINYPAQTFILRNFREFYAEVLRLKELATYLTAGGPSLSRKKTKKGEDKATAADAKQKMPAAPEGVTTPTPSELDTVVHRVQEIQRRLRLLFEEQSLGAAKQVGEFAASHYQEAQYIMVALADEVFLNLDWQGKVHWEKSMLETQVFHTQIAGELFFKRLGSLIEANDPVRMDLAIVYLLSLGLGFQGQYRDTDQLEKLDWYRHRLFAMINRKPSDLFVPEREQLIEGCYQHKLTELPGKGLPDVKVWVLSFVGIGTAYLFVAYVLWYTIVRDLEQSLGYVLEQAKNLPLA